MFKLSRWLQKISCLIHKHWYKVIGVCFSSLMHHSFDTSIEKDILYFRICRDTFANAAFQIPIATFSNTTTSNYCLISQILFLAAALNMLSTVSKICAGSEENVQHASQTGTLASAQNTSTSDELRLSGQTRTQTASSMCDQPYVSSNKQKYFTTSHNYTWLTSAQSSQFRKGQLL